MSKSDIDKNPDEIANLKELLFAQERQATIGLLTAGILHEIKNPLNFVNNFSKLSADLIIELKEIIDKNKNTFNNDLILDFEDIMKAMESNNAKVLEHGQRAQRIVLGMLSQSNSRLAEPIPVDLNVLVDDYTKLAYHGVRGEDNTFNATLLYDFDKTIDKIKAYPQELSRVILNLVNNSCYAVNEKKKNSDTNYSPEIKVSTKKTGQGFEIKIYDNGTGIPESVKQKLFTPFVTSKPSGKGTGLGLSICKDIIENLHQGKILLNTETGQFTEFTLFLPDNGL